jgi:hypothetical protein
MRFAPVKTARGAGAASGTPAVGESRTALINQARGLLVEHGIVITQGRAQLHRSLARILEDAGHRVSGIMRELFGEIAEWLNSSASGAGRAGRFDNRDYRLPLS